MKFFRIKSISLIFSLFLLNTMIHAETQSISIIQSKIENFLLEALKSTGSEHVSVKAGAIDERLQLKSCPNNALQIFNPYTTPIQQLTTVGVRCKTDDISWTLYAPVKISIQQQVLVAGHPLAQGSRIQADDLMLMPVDITQLNQGYFTDITDVVNHHARRPIQSGSPITPSIIELPILVHRNELVDIQAKNEVINVMMKGVALQDGRLGETIPVKNSTSNRVVEAEVSGKQSVKVTI